MTNPMLRVQFTTFSGRRYIATLTLPENFNVDRSYTDQIKFALLGIWPKKLWLYKMYLTIDHE